MMSVMAVMGSLAADGCRRASTGSRTPLSCPVKAGHPVAERTPWAASGEPNDGFVPALARTTLRIMAMAKKAAAALRHLGKLSRLPASPAEAVLDRVANPHADTGYVTRYTA